MPMRAATLFFCGAFLTLAILAPGAMAQELSHDSLVALQKSHLSDQVIVSQIEKDGISFEMTPTMTIQLKSEGFSDAIITALLTTAKKSTSAIDAKALYSQGKFAELIDLLTKRLATNPNGYKDRATLILVLLRSSKTETALSQLATLQQEATSSTEAKTYVDQIQQVLASIDKNKKDKERLILAISRFDESGANSVIDSMQIRPTERDLLKVNMLILAGRFSDASSQLKIINEAPSVDSSEISAMQEQIRSYESQYQESNERAGRFLHSPEAVEDCDAYTTTVIRALPLKDYIEAVGKLLSISPLNRTVIDLAFHATLISSPYEKVQTLGDEILDSVGQIRIQGYSTDRYFALVIDDKKKMIHTEDDSTPFVTTRGKNKNGWNGDLIPFTLQYDQITSISQKAGGSLAGAVWKNPYLLEKGAYALKFSPTGQVPQYAMMDLLMCSAGQGAQQTATYNLGKFVQHRLNSDRIKVNLVKPKEVYTDAGAPILQGLLAFQGAQGGQQGALANIAAVGLAQQMANESKAAERAQATWQQLFNRQSFEPTRTESFQQMERVLGVQ